MSSKNIKGITIEIGGETQKLQNALKEVNGKSRDLQSELREVDRLLKLDPENIDLIAQKQKLVGEQVEKVSEKLAVLKEAQRQIAKQFEDGKVGEEQYRAIQREVIQAEQEMKKLEDTVKRTNISMSDISKVFKDFGGGATKAGQMLLPVSAAATAAGVASAKLGIDLSDAMAKISTVSDPSVPLDQLREGILQLSNDSGVAAVEIANNVYDAISAGQQTADAVNFVKGSTDLAKAGFAEAGDTLDVLTSILNAYGMSAEETTRVSDILIQTQNKGKVTVGDLSTSIGKIIPTAKMAGVNLEQLGAGYAILTSNGIASAEATTYMNSMLNEMSKTGSQADVVLRSMTGKNFIELTKEGKSLADVLQILNDDAVKNKYILADTFGSSEAAKAAMTLLGDSSENFNNVLKDMQASAGSTTTALSKLDTPGRELSKSFNTLANSGIEIGTALTPAILALADVISSVAKSLTGMDEGTRNVVIGIVAFVAILGPLLMFVGQVATGIGALTALFAGTAGTAAVAGTAVAGAGVASGAAAGGIGLLSGALAILTSPITLIILAVATLAAGIIYLWKANDGFRDGCLKAWDIIKTAGVAVWTWLKKFFGEDIPQAITGAIDWFKKLPTNVAKFFSELPIKLAEHLGNTLSKIGKFGTDALASVNLDVPKIISAVVGFFFGMPGKLAVELFKSREEIAKWITGAIDKVTTEAPKIVNAVVNGVASLPGKMLDVGSNLIKGLWEGISTKTDWIQRKVNDFAKDMLGGIKDFFGIQSPSKVMQDEVGAMLGEGLGLGIESKYGRIEKAMRGANARLQIDEIKGSKGMGSNTSDKPLIINIYGDVDSDKRVKDLAQAFNKEAKRTQRGAGIRGAYQPV